MAGLSALVRKKLSGSIDNTRLAKLTNLHGVIM